MKMLIITGIALIAVLSYTCTTYVRTQPRIEQTELPATCSGLIPIISDQWLKNRKKNYFYGKDDFLTVLQRDYRECIMQLDRNRIIELFGVPVEEDSGHVFYFLDEGCDEITPTNCNILIFYIDDDDTGLVFEYLTQPFGFSH